MQETNPEEQNIQLLIKRHYLECRKAEFILNKLILPLEELPGITLKDKFHLELFILLISRCKANISFSLYSIKQLSGGAFSDSFERELRLLKDQVDMKFQNYCGRLQKKENKFSSIIKDRFNKMVYTQEFTQKEKFVNGIENIDFSKTEQVDFTYLRYI